jgi:hypothetical protein
MYTQIIKLNNYEKTVYLINEAPIQLSEIIFWPLDFPTINVIPPTDKIIKADLWDNWNQVNNATSSIGDVWSN